MNYNPEQINDFITSACQDMSYKFSDLVLSYPYSLRAVVMATAFSCIISNYQTMTEDAREIFDLCLPKLKIMTIPKALDPQKFGRQNREEDKG